MKQARLALGWIIVAIPLLYGVYQALTKVAALFG
ncbi:MFS transporter small subunit [Cryobacterium lyxosi]